MAGSLLGWLRGEVDEDGTPPAGERGRCAGDYRRRREREVQSLSETTTLAGLE